MSIMTGSEPVGRPLRQRLLEPLTQRCKAIATSGLSPRQLTLTLCIGGALGVLPLIWGTSLICFLLAHRFRLNHLVLQSVNYLLYPVQLALLIPFCKLGLLLIPWGPAVLPDQLSTLTQTGISGAFSLVFWLTFKALLAWLITVPMLSLAMYLILLGTVNRRCRKSLQTRQVGFLKLRTSGN